MIVTLQILQLVVGCLMIVAFGVWLYFNFRWNQPSSTNADGGIDDAKKATLSRYMKLIIIFLVIPNVILIFLSRGLS